MRADYSVDEPATTSLREKLRQQREYAKRVAKSNGTSKKKTAVEAAYKKNANGVVNGVEKEEEEEDSNPLWYDRGGTIRQVMERCEEETGHKPPQPQWEKHPYGPHAGLPYVKEWYAKMRKGGLGVWDDI